jgi:hypothetical protein
VAPGRHRAGRDDVLLGASGQLRLVDPMSNSSTGTLWFLPTQNVDQPRWRSTSAQNAFSIGMCVLLPGKPVALSAIVAKPFW